MFIINYRYFYFFK